MRSVKEEMQGNRGTEQPVPMIVGDLHISDKYSGRHVDYFQDCLDFCKMITSEIKKNKVTHLILTGDLFGRTTEKNLQSRDSLLLVMKVYQLWNELTNGNVYSIRGNHDYAQKTTDFELFVSVGLIKVVDQLDIGGVRFHMFNYGEHTRPIEVDPERYNVAVMHTHLQVEGQTTWFRGGPDGVELSSLDNLYGVDLVVAGHIHDPSIKLVSTSIKDHDISLFYPGCGTRPRYDRNLWEVCFGLLLPTIDEVVNLKQVEFKLKPVDEVFQSTYDDKVKQDEEQEESAVFSIEELSDVLAELKKYNLMGEEDYKSQIKKMGGLDEKAINLALQYVERAEAKLK